jgi:predicted permease
MSIISDLVERLRALVFRRREERELEEELHFHLEMSEAQHRHLGASPSEARRLGRVDLGGIERTKDEVRDARGTRVAEDSASDFRYALRGLRQRPGFAIVAVLTLAVGIGGTTAVFSAVDAVLLQPLPYQQSGQLVRLYQHEVGSTEKGVVTPTHFLDYQRRLSSFEHLAAIYTYAETGADVGGAERPERIQLLPITADYFGVYGVQPAIGRGFEPAEETGAPLVILGDALWTRLFARNPDVIGRSITMSGQPYTIVGVMPATFADPVAAGIDAWTPLDITPGRDADNAGNHYLTVVGRLRAGVSIEQANAELHALDVTLAAQYPNARLTRASLVPLKEDIVGPASRSLRLMLGAVGLVLLLVCVNIANLLLVRGSERRRVFAARSARGAERARLVRQILMESLTLALVGDIAGLAIARGAMSAIVALGAGSIPRLSTLTLEPRLLAFSIAVASLCALIFGVVPALRAARTEPGDVLREQARSGTSGVSQGRLRWGLVVSQVALAFVLLVGAGLLLASFQRLRQVDLGVTTDDVLTFELELPEARYDSTARTRLYETLAQRLAQIPGVRAAGGVSKLAGTGNHHMWGVRALTGPLVDAPSAATRPAPQQRVVSGDYFRAMGLRVLKGRLFDARDDASAPRRVVISTSAAARIFPGIDPLGQRLRTGGVDAEVIGVVPDAAVDAEGTMMPHVYHWHTQFAGNRNWALAQVVATTGAPEPLVPAVRRVVAELDPQLVMFRPMSFGDRVGRGTAGRLFTMRILTTFAAVALALVALGLFGVLSYAVKLRAREFGIRMALGAHAPAIRRMVLRQGLTVTALGVAIGLAGALAVSRVMASLVFRVSPLDPLVLGGAVLFMAAIAIVAAYLPARRATTVDPRTVLQGE